MNIKAKKIGEIKFLYGGRKKMAEGEHINIDTLRSRLEITDLDEYRTPEIIATQVKAVKLYGGQPVDLSGKPFWPAYLLKEVRKNK